MQKRRLGRTDLSIAPLVLGGNVFGWTADEKTSFDLLDRFVGAGLNAVDTADAYSRWVPGHKGGESETIIGNWMKDRGNRDKVVVITKVGSDMGQGHKDLSAAYIEKAVDASLKRLQIDAIDLYLSHWPDPTTPYEETLGAYEKLLAEGKVRHIGCSNLDAGQLRAALDVASLRSLPRYEVLQPEYNLYDRSSFDGPLRDLCVAEDIGVITYFSLAKGFLSGNTAARPILGSPRGGGERLPNRAARASSRHSMRCRPGIRPSRRRWRCLLSRGQASPRRSPAPLKPGTDGQPDQGGVAEIDRDDTAELDKASG